jgi:predicted transcriptional regulator of viral defense system
VDGACCFDVGHGVAYERRGCRGDQVRVRSCAAGVGWAVVMASTSWVVKASAPRTGKRDPRTATSGHQVLFLTLKNWTDDIYRKSNTFGDRRRSGVPISRPAGITGRGRVELARVLSSGKRFVTPADVAEALGIDPDMAAKKLARWAEDSWVRRVRRGLYIGVPVDAANPAAWSEDALLVAAAVWSPCYFTGWTAASHWALTDQVFRTTVLKTTGRVRSSTARLLDHYYLVGHTDDSAMEWGLKSQWKEGVRLRFADPAKNVIEILDDPKLGGGIRHAAEILGTFLDEHDPATLIEYGDRLGNRAVFKRLGYMVETLERDVSHVTAACLERVSVGISALDPDGPTGGRRVTRWGLRVNVGLAPEEPA